MTTSLYDAIIDIAEIYLGPAAPRFIDRQIEFHLNKPPRDITEKDLEKLTDWVKVSLSMLTDDQQVVEDFNEKMARLRK